MSREKFDNECPKCRPVLVNFKTRQTVPEDAPESQAILGVWKKTTLEEREAFHRFTCQNSRTPNDIAIINSLNDRMSKALKELG